MLNTETNTPAMLKRIKHAWVQQKIARGGVSLDFEHGQWWVTHLVTGAQWSVHDCADLQGEDTFDFEQVTCGDDD